MNNEVNSNNQINEKKLGMIVGIIVLLVGILFFVGLCILGKESPYLESAKIIFVFPITIFIIGLTIIIYTFFKSRVQKTIFDKSKFSIWNYILKFVFIGFILYILILSFKAYGSKVNYLLVPFVFILIVLISLFSNLIRDLYFKGKIKLDILRLIEIKIFLRNITKKIFLILYGVVLILIEFLIVKEIILKNMTVGDGIINFIFTIPFCIIGILLLRKTFSKKN